MKKIFVIILSCLMVFGLYACQDTTVPEQGDGYVIALAINALDEYQVDALGYVTRYAEALGHKIIHTNAEGKVDKQIADVESLIQMRPDVIAIYSVDREGLVPAFEACEQAGIKSVDYMFGSSFENTLHLNMSQWEFGALQGEWCNNWLAKNPDENLLVGYISGIQWGGGWDRFLGFSAAVENGPYADRYELLVEKMCNWSASEAMAAVEDWMQAYPEMNTIVSMSDEMAIAAVNVVQAAGRSDSVSVLGIDGSPNGQVFIREGTLAGSSYISREHTSQAAIDHIIKLIEGEDLRGQTIDVGSGLYVFLTKDNIDEVLGGK